MADRIGRGVIEITADARGFKAQMDEARKSIADLGKGQRDVSAAASRSIDQYIARLKLQNSTLGMSSREAQIFRLAAKGASDAQISAANAALLFQERQEATVRTMAALRAGLVATGAAIAGFALAGRHIAETADELGKLSQRTGISVEALSALKFQADLSGVSFEQLQNSLRFYNARVSDAAGGSKEALASFQAMGFTQQDVQAALADSEKFLARVADKFAGYADGASRSALAADVFGAKNEKLVLLLSQGSAGIQAARQELERYSAIIGPDLAKRSEEFNDNITRLKYIAEGLGISIGNSLIPKLADLSNELLQGTQIAGGFGKALMLLSSINPFRTVGDNIKSVRQEIERLQEAQARTIAQGRSGLAAQYGKAIEAEQKKLAFLQFQQRAAIPTGDPSTLDARDLRRLQGEAKPQAPVVDKSENNDDQRRKASLEAALAAIRRESDASIAEFTRSERILEAVRDNALNDEAAYFNAKRAFITLNLAQVERAAAAELEILNKQVFTGKNAAVERIQNDERIAEVQAKLAKARADAIVETVLLDTQQEGSLRKLQQSFDDAKASADAYIDSLRRRNALELAGIGKGTKLRDERAGEADIESKFIQRRDELAGELRRNQITKEVHDTYLEQAADTYRREVQLYRQRTIDIDDSQRNWLNGAREAFANYIDETRNLSKQFEDAFSNSIKRTEDTLVEFFDTGKLDFKSFASSIVSEMNRIFVRQRITGPLSEAISKGNTLPDIFGGLMGTPFLGPGTQLPAPVINRDPGSAIIGAATGEAGFTASVAAAGTSFSATTVTAGTSIAATLTSAGASITATLTAAASAFASAVAAAGSAFASMVTASSAGGGGGGIVSAGIDLLGSFATGTPYVPQTGPYMLHEGERVIPAGQNAMGGGQPISISITQAFAPGTDRRTVAQAGVETARSLQRELARNTA